MLKPLIQTMLAEASLKENAPVERKLPGGLHIAIAVTKSRTPGVEKDVHLSLARDKVYPSMEEWKTVLANFPYRVPNVEPIKFVDRKRRFAMRAKLPSRESLPQQMGLPVTEND
jgi:hypothetical protein